jgi:hypothetical protein
MRTEPFQYVRDAIDRIDSSGFGDWSTRRREALARIAFAENAYELELSKAQTRGVITACSLLVLADILLVAFYIWYRGSL